MADLGGRDGSGNTSSDTTGASAPGSPELPPVVLIVMGVSGSGKSTIAEALADRLGAEFADGDAFHPAANVEKMRAGIPLTDADRGPWLAAIAAWIGARLAAGRSGVVACSALRRAYRRVLVAGRADVELVYLHGGRDLIAARIGGRRGHYMPASLLDSQFATLEEPGPDERPIVAEIDADPDAITEAVMATLAARRTTDGPPPAAKED